MNGAFFCFTELFPFPCFLFLHIARPILVYFFFFHLRSRTLGLPKAVAAKLSFRLRFELLKKSHIAHDRYKFRTIEVKQRRTYAANLLYMNIYKNLLRVIWYMSRTRTTRQTTISCFGYICITWSRC